MNTEKMMSMVNEALRMAKEADAKLGLDDLEQASGGNVIAGPEDIRRMMGGDEPEELGKLAEEIRKLYHQNGDWDETEEFFKKLAQDEPKGCIF